MDELGSTPLDREMKRLEEAAAVAPKPRDVSIPLTRQEKNRLKRNRQRTKIAKKNRKKNRRKK